MRQVFDYEQLMGFAEEHREEYENAAPYPHCVIDNAGLPEIFDEVLDVFPTPQQFKWFKYDNPLEKKLAMNHLDRLPEIHKDVLYEFNSGRFISFLQHLTGVQGLVPDPHYYGGGLHQIERGGKLDIHADFNIHPILKLDRRINVIFFLNKNWKEEFGGYLELWDKKMERAEHKILPIYNRMVIFKISDESFHGHPEPLQCPEGWTRKSLALYYYTNGRPESERSEPHSTIYMKRPIDPENKELDALRSQRRKGRIRDLTT